MALTKSQVDPACPKCGSDNVKYLGFEDSEVYECRECGELFGHEDPTHT